MQPNYQWQLDNPACSSLRPATLRVMGVAYELLCVIFYGGDYGLHYMAEFQHGSCWYSCNDLHGDKLVALPGPAHAAQPFRDSVLPIPVWPNANHEAVHTVLYTRMRHWTFTQRREAHSLVTFSLRVMLRGAHKSARAHGLCIRCRKHRQGAKLRLDEVREAEGRLVLHNDESVHAATHGSVLLEHFLNAVTRNAIFSYMPLTVPLHMW
jgi:hypothetical protein